MLYYPYIKAFYGERGEMTTFGWILIIGFFVLGAIGSVLHWL